LVDTTDQIILECEYSGIRIFDHNIIARKEKNYQLFDKKGNNFLEKSYKYIKIEKELDDLVILKTKTNNFGLIQLNDDFNGVAKTLLDTIFSKIHLSKDGKISAYSKDKATYFEYSYQNEGIKFIKEGQTEEEVEVEIEFIDHAINDKGPTKLKNYTKYSVWRYSVDTAIYLIETKRHFENGMNISTERDTLRDKPYKHLKGYWDRIYARDFNTEQDSVLWGKYHGNEVFSAIVTDLNDKVGLLNGYGELLIDFQYDKIERLNRTGKISYLHVVKNNKHGIVNPYNKILVPIEMDEIKKISHFLYNFHFQKNKLNGVFRLNGILKNNDYCPPIYSETIKKVIYIYDYFLVELENEEGEFLGYANNNGIKYFEE